MPDALRYIAGYPDELREQAAAMLRSGELAPMLAQRYPDLHDVHSNKLLHAYVQELKSQYMRKAAPLNRVLYDERLRVVQGALGLHKTRTMAHGGKQRTQREVRIASVFKDMSPEFLRMIVVHELAHMKHADHSRDFYSLCEYMEPDYHQLEFDLRLALTLRDQDHPNT